MRNHKKTITIIDIARMADVSPSSVSIVINDKPGVSDETRRRVKEIIKTMDYIPNLNSRKLILRKSFNIFIIIDNNDASFDNMFYNKAITGMLDLCGSCGYNIVLAKTDHKYHDSALYRAVAQKNVDGAIFLGDPGEELTSDLTHDKIPFVILDSHKLSCSYHRVYCDYSAASYTAVSYLIKSGHTKIGYAGMGSIPEFFVDAFNGYIKALGENGISCNSSWVISASTECGELLEKINRFSELSAIPTAMFCATDMLAIEIMGRLTELGINIPEDISFCAIDNILLSKYCSPALTTVDIDKGLMGTRAIEMLIDLINDKNTDSFIIPSNVIVERDSVKKLINY